MKLKRLNSGKFPKKIIRSEVTLINFLFELQFTSFGQALIN